MGIQEVLIPKQHNTIQVLSHNNTVLSAEEITTGLSRADRNVADDLSFSAPQKKQIEPSHINL